MEHAFKANVPPFSMSTEMCNLFSVDLEASSSRIFPFLDHNKWFLLQILSNICYIIYSMCIEIHKLHQLINPFVFITKSRQASIMWLMSIFGKLVSGTDRNLVVKIGIKLRILYFTLITTLLDSLHCDCVNFGRNADIISVLTMLSPITLNAYYHRERNEVIFPAGMMQPPFYNPWSPKSLNYGGIGVIIGHEITHLLDVEVLEETDSEKVFTKKSLLNFLKRSKCVYDHYETITIDLPEQQKQQKRIKARQENIADMSGVKLAFEALKKWEKENHAEMLLPGLSLNHNQLFFLNYAQVWCEVKKKKLNGLKKANTHSPKHMRVIGPLSNSEDFAKVYSCSERSNMNPKNKCTVW
ncbi:Neprilysin-1 [Nymphon striatum]|nr:Neprilysin-1 [Nymphon striatum]